jgi:hypothetical protein
MATAPRLDPEVVALVLQHVSQQHRMRSCALVCTDWKAGAALATKQVGDIVCSERGSKGRAVTLEISHLGFVLASYPPLRLMLTHRFICI